MSDEAYDEYTLRQYRAGDANVRIFYKYQAFRSYTIPTLTGQQIYLSKFAQLNDPFDPFLSALNANHPAGLVGQDDYSESVLRIFADTGIFCVSETPNNQLLWAHYGDAYRGFCIGYAAYVVPNPRVLHPVQYIGRVPRKLLLRQSLSPQELLEGFLLSKPRAWSYEREWRFMMAGDVGLVRTMFPIVQVIFGPRMPLDQRTALVDATRATDPDTRVAQPKVVNGHFEILLEKTTPLP